MCVMTMSIKSKMQNIGRSIRYRQRKNTDDGICAMRSEYDFMQLKNHKNDRKRDPDIVKIRRRSSWQYCV